jgi:GAF domain-containing protein
MLKPPRPEDESQRQALLDASGLLQAGRIELLDDIVRLASIICRVPISAVSLIDRDRQFFTAKVGLDVDETPRDVSFCGHAILQEGPFIVPDAAADPRFADNPLVTGPPHIRFYAGVPLNVDDCHALGTLCIIDSSPRHPDPAMLEALERLGKIVRLHLAETLRRESGEP